MKKQLLICDLDNTLYDWVDYFVPSLYAMIDKALEITGWDRDTLLNDLKEVHQKHHDSEHPFALLETKLVKDEFGENGKAIARRFLDEAFHAFNSERKARLKTFPFVHETLSELRSSDIALVAHTEAKFHAVADRLRRLNLVDHFEKVFCRERSQIDHPDGKSISEWLDGFPVDKFTELKHHERKPNPTVLLEICESMGVPHDHAAYVGDSMAHDIMMAKDAEVYAIHAKYGTKRNPVAWEKLVRVTHWTDEDVEREASLREEALSVVPDYVAQESFAEVLNALRGINLST